MKFLPLCLLVFFGTKLTDMRPVISLFHGGCYGRCPVYSIDIYEDGRVRYIGSNFVLFKDTEYGRIELDTLHSILLDAEQEGFFHKDTVVNNNGVGTMLFDASSTTIKIMRDGSYIQKNSGFTSLELHIERSSHVLRWIGAWWDLNKRELNYSTRFPGSDSLTAQLAYWDSLEKAKAIDFETWQKKRAVPGQEWYRRLKIYDQSRIDSVDAALRIYYRSITDRQVDSLWRVENKQ